MRSSAGLVVLPLWCISTIFLAEDVGSTDTCVRIGWLQELEVLQGELCLHCLCISTIFPSEDVDTTDTCVRIVWLEVLEVLQGE